VLLLDLAPGLPPDGVFLGNVRTVLVTHAHPDHCSPFALLWRHWAHRREVLTVIGPAPVLEECHPWLWPDDPVDLVEAVPGRTLICGDHAVRVLAADHEVPTVLHDVAGARRRPAAVRDRHRTPAAADGGGGAGRRLRAGLLEQTFGDVVDHGTRHLDLATFPQQLDRLCASARSPT
jgi:adenosylcobinamide kinase/adenosylcobinamide-phosphate guanylyltransferase